MVHDSQPSQQDELGVTFQSSSQSNLPAQDDPAELSGVSSPVKSCKLSTDLGDDADIGRHLVSSTKDTTVEARGRRRSRVASTMSYSNEAERDDRLQSGSAFTKFPDATSPTVQPNESECSSGSSSTVTQDTPGKRTSTGKTDTKPRKQLANRPDALNFLDPNSPKVTPERIEMTVKEASQRSPVSVKGGSPSTQSTASTLSSGFQDDTSDTLADHETDLSSSPDRSVDGDHVQRLSVKAGRPVEANKHRKRSYGTPEMPRGPVYHPHISPEALTPRVPFQPQPKYLPRAEKLPLTGYEQLASRLSLGSSDQGGPMLRPIYRRFETLNHRILLHLQDEICELEEQLHRLDTADTQNRRSQGGLIPASRRAEALSGGELQWHKTDTLAKIGFKLEQYNRVLAAFAKTQFLPPPALADVHEYRGYLATHAPIAEPETRFLDAADDLVCLAGGGDDDADEDPLATPMPRFDFAAPGPKVADAPAEPSPEAWKGADPPPPVPLLSLAVALAVVLPVLTFSVIPDYVGRATVIGLVGMGISGTLVQGHLVGVRARDICVCAGLYGAVMAVLARIVA
ncbi:hypothetical protein F4780DRAFT_776749 [Xylariomycetidae sp. FL0641]|nr:hypothetical protein F4780DRAFT_776749 [Xylariomycetidae sp. FL0641]